MGTTGSSGDSVTELYIDSTNLIYDYTSETLTSTSFNAASDYRIKENIKLLDLSEYSVDHLKPIIYDHIGAKKTNIGFLAHEVQEYFPFLVAGVKDGPTNQSINYTGLIGVLTKEIQELKKRVSILESESKSKNKIEIK